MDIAEMINKYGFPVIAAAGMGYFIYYVWTWVTTEIKPVIGAANGTLIALIDRIRMLDNDLIRLNQKVETVMALRGKTIEKERMLAESDINQDPFKKRREEQEAKKAHEEITKKPSVKKKATAEEIKEAAGDD
jgi:hypothetical protein